MKKTKINFEKHYYMVFLILGAIMPFMVTNGAFAVSTLSVTSSGSQSIDVSPTSDTAIASDSINVATTCRYGYNFTIQTSVEDNALYLDGDSEYFDTVFYPVDDTMPLNTYYNQWGYFYYYDDYSEEYIVPTSDDVFSPVPSSSEFEEPAVIKAPLGTPSLSDINDSFNIYYGVSVAPDAASGTYKMVPDGSNNDGTIVYTVTVADECSRYTVHFSPTSIFEGNTLSGTGTMDDQVIYYGVPTALDDMDFNVPSGYYFAGWNTAQDGSGTQYTDGQQVTDIVTPGNDITLYAQWTDCASNKVCYSPNVSNPSDVEGEMDDMSLRFFETDVVLHASNYSRANYGFAGWNTKPDGTGIYYGPNQTYEYGDITGSNNVLGLKLYAQWVASAGNMQNWTCPNNTDMPIGTVTALKDTRDNNVYAVAKLADGKCWMIENLRLDNTASHNSDGTLAQGYASNFIGLANPESAHFDGNDGTANSIYSTDGSTAVRITGMYVNYRIPRYNNTNTSSRYSGTSDYYGDSNTYSYGNYYTWAAAIADTGYYNTDGQSVTTTSICPTGWHLPTGGSSGEAYTLNTAVNAGATDTAASNVLRSYPNNFLVSGEKSNATGFYARGNWGSHWTPMVEDQFFAYTFEVGTYFVDPAISSRSKSFGYSIRCVADY